MRSLSQKSLEISKVKEFVKKEAIFVGKRKLNTVLAEIPQYIAHV